MKKIILYLLFLLVLSCSIKKSIYEHFLCEYKFIVPSGFTRTILDNGEEAIRLYKYPDSSVFYISFNTTLNDENLKKEEKYYTWLIDFYKGDSITYEGKNLSNKYWKDHILDKMLSIGYINVPKERKKEFDKAIASAEKLKGIGKWWRKTIGNCH